MNPLRRAVLPLLLVGSLMGGLAVAAPPAAPERRKGGGVSFTPFPTLTATVAKPGGRRGVLAVEAGIDAPDAAVRARAALMEPVLRDAYVQFLTHYAASLAPQQLPDAEVIGAGLQQATDRVLGRKGAVLLMGSILIN